MTLGEEREICKAFWDKLTEAGYTCFNDITAGESRTCCIKELTRDNNGYKATIRLDFLAHMLVQGVLAVHCKDMTGRYSDKPATLLHIFDKWDWEDGYTIQDIESAAWGVWQHDWLDYF